MRCGGTGASPQELKLGSRGVCITPGGSLGRTPRWYTLQLTPEQALQEASGSLQLQVCQVSSGKQQDVLLPGLQKGDD